MRFSHFIVMGSFWLNIRQCYSFEVLCPCHSIPIWQNECKNTRDNKSEKKNLFTLCLSPVVYYGSNLCEPECWRLRDLIYDGIVFKGNPISFRIVGKPLLRCTYVLQYMCRKRLNHLYFFLLSLLFFLF